MILATNKDVIFPPSNLLSDEPQLETYLHLRQLIALFTSLEWCWQDRQDFFAAGNLTIYYSPHQRKSEDFRGPDFFVVLGTERKPRNSWVVWEENGQYPNVIIEVLSDSTAATDRGLKKQIYQNIFRTPDYFWFDPETMEFEGFQLMAGQYQELPLNQQGWRWSQQLGLYLGVYESQLRFFTPAGQLVLTPTEAANQTKQQAAQEQQRAEQQQQRADQEQQRAEQQQQRADQEKQRAERLAQQLRDLGIDPTE